MQKQDIKAVAAIFLFYAVIELFGVTCPIRFVTGISCAGCGMSRAWLSLLRLDFSAAFHYHPLFWLPVPAALLFWFRNRVPQWLYRGGLGAAAGLFAAVYVIRLFDGKDPIVTFAPGEGILYQAYSWLLSGISGSFRGL